MSQVADRAPTLKSLRMNGRDHTFTVALIASLIVHVAVALVVADRALRGAGGTVAATAAATNPPPPPTPDVSYVLPAPPPQRLEELLFGEATGAGDALNARRGARPMIGRDGGQTQAFLSRDPIGPGEIVKEPAMSVLPTGTAASATPAAPPPAPTVLHAPSEWAVPPESRVPFGLADRVEQWTAPRVPRPAARAAKSATPPAEADATREPGAPTPAADPAIPSDSESDPFTKNDQPAVEFRDGNVEARFGRKVRTVRPHLSLASRLDLMSMRFPRLVVRVHIHTDGAVRRVDIVKPSGSPSADQEVKVALYQWWFEPTDENVVEFPITWR